MPGMKSILCTKEVIIFVPDHLESKWQAFIGPPNPFQIYSHKSDLGPHINNLIKSCKSLLLLLLKLFSRLIGCQLKSGLILRFFYNLWSNMVWPTIYTELLFRCVPNRDLSSSHMSCYRANTPLDAYTRVNWSSLLSPNVKVSFWKAF